MKASSPGLPKRNPGMELANAFSVELANAFSVICLVSTNIHTSAAYVILLNAESGYEPRRLSSSCGLKQAAAPDTPQYKINLVVLAAELD
jgi:hypothetical protein